VTQSEIAWRTRRAQRTARAIAIGGHLFAARTLPDGDRIDLTISAADQAEFIGEYDVTVTDLGTGLRWRVRRADCGLGCRCDAIAEPAAR